MKSLILKTISKEYLMDFLFIILIIGLISLFRDLDPILIKPVTKLSAPIYQEIILPPLEQRDIGFLRKSPRAKTIPASPLKALSAEFYIVTAYAVGDDYTPGKITTDGRLVRPGITVACPQELMLGTAVYIENLGVRICEDRGSAIVGKRLDVAFPSLESAKMFGNQRLAVVIIR